METLNQQRRQAVLDIISKARDMTLATVRPDGYPQATTVSFASDELILYVGIGLDSQKAHNIQLNNKVSLTINTEYADWNHIKGLSMGAVAEIVSKPEEMQHAAQCMLQRFPQIKTFTVGTNALPWAGAIFLRISPQVISLLDYEQGFGHTELFAVA
jgi:general stress protein 26